MKNDLRVERLQVMLSPEELAAVDDFTSSVYVVLEPAAEVMVRL